MKIFKFDVDESFAKANNELLRDSNRLRISGLVLGILLIIGGAEDKVGRVTVLRRFVRLAGGRKARIVVIPTASSVPDEVVEATRARYIEAYERLSGERFADFLSPEA